MIVVIDYGLGNLKSILNMLAHINVKAVISKNPDEIRMADKLILPGVGSFDSGMKNLRDSGLIHVLNDVVLKDKKPVLGICLGMQLMTESSEEGEGQGLGWIKAKTKRFQFQVEDLKIPHMGWNFVKPIDCSSLFKDLNNDESRFYFVHSFYVDCADKSNILAQCIYGMEFTCAIAKDNIYGVQFHPEKSHKFGMKLLTNFAGCNLSC